MIELLRRGLQQYSLTNAVQEEQAIKEMLQEVALYALWRKLQTVAEKMKFLFY